MTALALAALLVSAGGAPGTGGEPAAPQVSNLRIQPKEFSSGKVTIRFRLDRAAKVDLVRLFQGATESGQGFIRIRDRRFAGEAGANRVRVSSSRMGHRRGRYLLRAQTTGPDHSADFASTYYRLVRD